MKWKKKFSPVGLTFIPIISHAYQIQLYRQHGDHFNIKEANATASIKIQLHIFIHRIGEVKEKFCFDISRQLYVIFYFQLDYY